MKIEKGNLYYDKVNREVRKAVTDFYDDNEVGTTNKIAVHCPTKEDISYVCRVKGWDLKPEKLNPNKPVYIYLSHKGFDLNVNKSYYVISISEFKKFYPEKTPERFYTKATPKLIELHKNYKGAKDIIRSYDDVSFFDNCNNFDQTGYFGSTHNSVKAYYIRNNYAEVTEEEFIKLMELEELDKELSPKKEESLKDVVLPITDEAIKFEEGKLTWEVDFDFLEGIAKRMEVSSKYPPYNWQKPLDHKKLLTAGFRHYVQIMKGDFEDDGQEYGHLFAVATNLMMAYYQLKNNKNNI